MNAATNRLKLAACALVAACVPLFPGRASAAWELNGSVLTDGNWSFACSFDAEDDSKITLTSRIAGSGDCNLAGLPGDYKVVKINVGVFKGCGSVLKSFSEPDTLTELADYQFFGCSAMTNFTGGGSVTKSGPGVFWTAPQLACPVSFPLLEKVPNGFLNGCSKVTSISFPAATYIDASAFSGCSGATNFVINFQELTYIGDSSFMSCAGLKGDLEMPKVTALRGLRGTRITSIKAPNAKEINGYCFFQTTSLTNVECEAVEKIDTERCFYQTQLQGAVRFPLLTKIPSGCFNLKSAVGLLELAV